MKEIKLTIDGREVQLTDEQLSMLGVEARSSPFKRGGQCVRYFYIGSDDNIHKDFDSYLAVENRRFERVNYFGDEELAHQVALHQLLYRELLKYAYDNGFEDEEWNGNNMHAYIIYNFTRKDYDVRWTRDEKEPGTVYFKSTTRATAALNEVVMPFVKEHPYFVW